MKYNYDIQLCQTFTIDDCIISSIRHCDTIYESQLCIPLVVGDGDNNLLIYDSLLNKSMMIDTTLIARDIQ